MHNTVSHQEAACSGLNNSEIECNVSTFFHSDKIKLRFLFVPFRICRFTGKFDLKFNSIIMRQGKYATLETGFNVMRNVETIYDKTIH